MCYSNTFVHRQKMLFWIDMTSDINASSVTPTKKRLWLVVSNDEINTTSSNLTAVPVYTRDEVTKDTHVAFKNGERDCVIVCEDIMSIPRRSIRPSNYAGFIDEETWSRVHNAIINQFSDNVPTNVRESINAILKDPEVTNTIINSIISMYKDTIRANTVINTNDNVTIPNKKLTTDTNITTKIVKSKESITADKTYSSHLSNEDAIAFLNDYDKLINNKLDEDTFWTRYKKYICTMDSTYLNAKTAAIRKRLAMHSIDCSLVGRKRMLNIPKDLIAQIYTDCNTLTYTEMNAKYPNYCHFTNHSDLSRKRNALKRRLINSGIIDIK